MEDLTLDDITLILGAAMDTGLSNETHVTNNKP